jgi:hypothetical protein
VTAPHRQAFLEELTGGVVVFALAAKHLPVFEKSPT